MCGIAGAVWTHARDAVDTGTLERMTRSLAHRGPDDSGTYFSVLDHSDGVSVALGHRRLSIIDLGGGHQPLASEDDSVWVVFNGEIFNYRELQADLAARGHRLRTQTDTEVIVHLYEEFGVRCVDHLRGMFAFAVWDDRRRELFVARDRLGQKPLFYRIRDGAMWFGSELKALLQIPGAPRAMDPIALDEFLTYQYVPAPRCILSGYHKLPAAHWALFDGTSLRLERYWSPPFAEGDDSRTAQTEPWGERLRETLTEAVRIRLRSDVPLGAFLSGGVDSTIICGLMQHLSPEPVHSFSIGFPVAQFDERSYARLAAEHLGTRHHEEIVTPDALSILPRLTWHYDEPFADSSAIPTMALSKMTRAHVTVALSGDGGDELFAGYERYKAVKIAAGIDRLPAAVKRVLAAGIWQRMPASVEQKSFRRRVKRLLAELQKPPERRYLRWVSILDDERRQALYSDALLHELAGVDSAAPLLEAYAVCPSRDFVTRTTCCDVLTYLPGDILTKVDIASMAYGLECRSPFLDHHVVELAARMPIGLKLQGRQGKRILIETFRDLLPERIQHRRKMGFGVPLDHWFRDELRELVHDVLLDDRSRSRDLFRPETVELLIHQHQNRQWDHSARLWTLLCLELWQRMFLDGEVPAHAPQSL